MEQLRAIELWLNPEVWKFQCCVNCHFNELGFFTLKKQPCLLAQPGGLDDDDDGGKDSKHLLNMTIIIINSKDLHSTLLQVLSSMLYIY